MFGVWIGDEEIQNIRLLQALSCNIPMIINDNIDKTSVPYWSNDAGIIYKDNNNFQETVRQFMVNIKNYKPREYIINNFTSEAISENYLSKIF